MVTHAILIERIFLHMKSSAKEISLLLRLRCSGLALNVDKAGDTCLNFGRRKEKKRCVISMEVMLFLGDFHIFHENPDRE